MARFSSCVDKGEDEQETGLGDALLDDDDEEVDDDSPKNQSILLSGGFNPEPEEQAERIRNDVYDGVSDFIRDELKLGRVRYDEKNPRNREFFKKVRLTYNKKSGNPNGLEFDGEKLYVMRKGEIVETQNVKLEKKLGDFKFLVRHLSEAYAKSDISVIDEATDTFVDRVIAEDIFENTKTDIRQTWDEELIELETFVDNAYKDVVGGKTTSFTDSEKEEEKPGVRKVNTAVKDLNNFIDAEVTDADILNGIAQRLNRDKNRLDAGGEENIGRQIITALSVGELSQDELSLPKNELDRLVEDKLAALVGKQTDVRNSSLQQQWRKLASEQRQKAREIDKQLDEAGSRQQTLRLEDRRKEHVKNAQLYDKVADLCDIRADEIRLQVGLKPESKRVVEMLKNNAEADPRTKFHKLMKWLVKNKYVQASAVIITILGGLSAFAGFLYDVLKKSAHGVKDFGNATYKVTKDTAKYVSEKGKTFYSALTAVGAAVYKVLSLLSGLVQTVAYYMWVVIIALAYFVYTKILGK